MPAWLPLSQVHIWHYSWGGSPDPARLEALYPALSSGEREQHRRFHFEKDRNTYLLAHVLLRRVLSRYGDRPPNAWDFVPGSHGKPSIVDPGREDLRFSLTHTAGLVACAARRHGEVGVDAERIDRACDFLAIARSMFAPAEVTQLENSRAEIQRDLFFRIWTSKEAYVKALGLGLSASLKDFSIEAGVPCIHFSSPAQGNESEWRLRLDTPTPHHVLATAFQMPCDPDVFVYDGATLLMGGM